MINQNTRMDCEICQRLFNNQTKLKLHQSTHNKSKTFCCDVCQKSFYNFYHLNNHMRKHDGRTPYRCEYCRRYFTTASGLSIHTKQHVGLMPHHCNIKPPSTKRHKCPTCEKLFARKNSLQIHQRLHNGETPRYACNYCSKRFHWESNLNTHRLSHSDVLHINCDQCKCQFSSSIELEWHRAFHASDVRFECIWCRKCFVSRHRLQYHITNSHVKLPEFRCLLCEKTFKFAQQLKLHATMHSDTRPQCYICCKKFMTKYNLKAHMVSHVSSKLLECDICGLRFTHKRNLYIHLKRHVHQRLINDGMMSNAVAAVKERKKKLAKLQCQTCGREFSYLKSLYKCNHRNVRSRKRTQKVDVELAAWTTALKPPQHSADNNVQVQVNIMLDNQTSPSVPLYEINIPNEANRTDDGKYVAGTTDHNVMDNTMDITNATSASSAMQNRSDLNQMHPSTDMHSHFITAPQPHRLEAKNDFYDLFVSDADYFSYPTFLNNAHYTHEPIHGYSVGLQSMPPMSPPPYNTYVLTREEPIDYSRQNIRLFENVTYREL